MKRKLLSISILLAISGHVFALDGTSTVQNANVPISTVTQEVKETSNIKYVQVMNEMAQKMKDRISELKIYAQNPDFFFYKDGKKYIKISDIDYEIDEQHGTPIIPLRNWADESATRGLFGFFDETWEFSWSEGGAVVVNKEWGNYDWGKACLLEYRPNTYVEKDFVLNETMSCRDGSYVAEPINSTYFAPYKFGVNAAYANMVSIEQIGDKMIVAQSPTAENMAHDVPMVGIYDSKANTTTKILGINASEPYKGLDDLRSHHSQLFVSAISAHNRIDVFSGDTIEYQYSFAVEHEGKGKIAVNDQYIFVADENHIAVYRNEAADAGEIKAITPFAYLAYAHTQPTSLEFVDSKLLVGGAQGSAVYDLAALSQGATLEPFVKNLPSFESMDANEKFILVKENNSQYIEATTRFAMYDVKQFIANNYQFKDAHKATYLINDFWVDGTDLLIRDDEIVSLTNTIIESVKFDKLDTLDFKANAYVPTAQLTLNALPQGATVVKIMEDGLNEGVQTLSANMASMVNVRVIDRDTVEITNFTPVDMKGLNLDIKAHNQHSWVRLANLDALPAYTRIILPITALNVDKSFNTVEGSGVYNYTDMLSTLEGKGNTYGHYGTLHLFDSRFETATKHPLLDKLNKIEATWDVKFTDRLVNAPEAEMPWDANSVKRHLNLLTNAAFIISSDAFKNKLMNYKETYGHDMFLYGATFETKAQYEELLTHTLKSNGFTNFRKKEGFQNAFTFGKSSGTTFGLSDKELDKIENGDLQDFALYLGDQIGNNWYVDCPPKPCDWTEIHFAKLFIDVYNELDKAGELPY